MSTLPCGTRSVLVVTFAAAVFSGCVLWQAANSAAAIRQLSERALAERWRTLAIILTQVPLERSSTGPLSLADRLGLLGYQIADSSGVVVGKPFPSGVPVIVAAEAGPTKSLDRPLRYDDVVLVSGEAEGGRLNCMILTGAFTHPEGFEGFLQVVDRTAGMDEAKAMSSWLVPWMLVGTWLAFLGAFTYSMPWRPRPEGTRAPREDPEAGRLRELLTQANAKIAEASRLQGRFVGNIAHEIKTPLAIVLSHAELLQACIDDPTTVRRYARSIAVDMQHLANLVESFLRLARAFGKDDVSQHVVVHVHDVVTDAVRRTQGLAADHAVTIVTTLEEPRPGAPSFEVLGDPVLLESMVENIIRNGVRFSPREGRLDVHVATERDSVVVTVRDRGAGIPPEHLDTIFDWFFDGPIPERKATGTGFGLALAKRVVEHHRGSITVRNCDDGGCEFRIVLPRGETRTTPSPLRSSDDIWSEGA